MMYSVVLKTESIAEKLQEHLNHVTLKWKNSEDTSSYGEAKPKVYAFTFDNLNGSYPLHTPSVLVQLMSVDDDGVCSYVVYCCVCNPALQDKETTIPVQGEENTYEYKTTSGLNTACVRSDLYKSCLMLGEQVYVALKKMSNNGESIYDVTFETPNPYMENFPYCECILKFSANLSITQTKLNTDLYDML